MTVSAPEHTNMHTHQFHFIGALKRGQIRSWSRSQTSKWSHLLSPNCKTVEWFQVLKRHPPPLYPIIQDSVIPSTSCIYFIVYLSFCLNTIIHHWFIVLSTVCSCSALSIEAKNTSSPSFYSLHKIQKGELLMCKLWGDNESESAVLEKFAIHQSTSYADWK